MNSLFGLPGSTPKTRLAAGLVSGLAFSPSTVEVTPSDTATPPEGASPGGKPATTAAGSAAGSALTKALAKDTTIGAVLADVVGSGSLKYMAVWTGLFILGLALILKGLGVKTPSPTKIIPVPE